MEESVTIEVAGRDGTSVVSLVGEVDMANAADTLRRLLALDDEAALVLDLGRLRYIDSAGIRMLFDLSEKLAEANRCLVLSVPDDAPVRRVLSITKLDTLMPVLGDVDAAIAVAGEASTT